MCERTNNTCRKFSALKSKPVPAQFHCGKIGILFSTPASEKTGASKGLWDLLGKGGRRIGAFFSILSE